MSTSCRCGCDRTTLYCRGLAKTCYERWREAGKPDVPPPPPDRRSGWLSRARAGRLEDYAELRSWGESIAAAAARVGISAKTAERWYEPELRRQVTA